ncbi:MAG: hypothetical protein IJA12_03450 [Oscillospiraceae bacterium]|nr:hypothetical protein [Oscillospiraceae bacterium]
MGVLKNNSIKSLLEGIDDYEQTNKRIKGSDFKSIKNLYEEFLKTDSKPQRDRLISEFKKRNEEFALFIQSNPELINTELQKSLLIAASGGEYAEEEITIDGRGRKKIKHTRKTALPDVSAARELLEMMSGSSSSESSMSEAWIESVLGGDENEE